MTAQGRPRTERNTLGTAGCQCLLSAHYTFPPRACHRRQRADAAVNRWAALCRLLVGEAMDDVHMGMQAPRHPWAAVWP
eukprot:scaffold1142_cov387-Prasinococcus_capsulatus_cf.AAC.19